MKVPFSWLKEYVDIDVTAQELEDKLFGCGFEVEELIDLSAEIDRVVVGVVKECTPVEGTHLCTCKVDCGEYGNDIQIVTGAPNVHEGELVVVIGSNGAGKSTLVRSIMGLVKPTAGEILFIGEHMEHMKSQDIVKKGLCLILEGRQLFAEMTVEEHLLMGAYTHRKNKDEVEKNLRRVYNLFPVLEENKNRIASSFSGGEQQMITLGRGLMLDPKLLIIDEMSLGLAPKVISTLFALIKQLNHEHMSILLIEQNAQQALKIADRGYVLENGRITMTGKGAELLNNEEVKTAYLGL